MNPYGEAAREYLAAGWSPLPLPYGKKAAPPTGYTGYSGKWATEREVKRWAEMLGARNIAVRAPETVLGLDVDSYKEAGAETIAEATARLGALPLTVKSTARDDGSGILWFRVPAGRKWKGVLGPGVDIVHHGDRYAVAPPSLHPQGMTYAWLDEVGMELDEVPNIAELPDLPELWVAELSTGDAADAEQRVDVETEAWLDRLPVGEPCPAMVRALDKHLPGLEGDPGGRHNAMTQGQFAVVRLGEQGHKGSAQALQRLQDAFVQAVAGERPGGDDEALREWERSLVGAVGRVAAKPTAPEDKGCCAERTSAADDFAEPLAEEVPRRSDGEDWMMANILPTRSYGVLDGPIGAGKSSILGHVVDRVVGKGYRVRYCVEDEPLATARHRLELLGTDMSLVELVEVPDLTGEKAIAEYAAECRSAGVDLVVMDLLVSANSAYEENRPEKVKGWTAQLVKWFCTRHGISLLGTHHWNNNTKAGSALARQSGGGALSAKAEFHWSVAMSNDRTEQVWSVHARRKITIASNRWMEGTGHLVGKLEDEYEGTPLELNVFTVAYKMDAGDRTAKHVADEAAKEYADGPHKRTSADVFFAAEDMLARFMAQPRRRAEVEEFLGWVSGETFGEQTVVKRLKDMGATQCSPEGAPLAGGKYWVVA